MKRLATVAAIAAAAAVTATTGTASGPRAGSPGARVGVHGAWTITIRTRRGGVVRRVRFHNAFIAPFMLADVLGMQSGVAGWAIRLEGGTGAQSATGPCGAGQACWITGTGRHAMSGGNDFVADTLTIAMPLSGTDGGKLVLHGTVTADQSGQIAAVRTLLGLCVYDSNPCSTTGSGSSGGPFTETSLATPIAVGANQIVDVTVRLSFTSVS